MTSLTFAKPSYGKFGETYLGKRYDSDTDANLSVTVYSSFDHIYSLNGSVAGANLQAAQWLLPYLASLPFDGNDTAESQQWVKSNLDKVREGHPIERTVYGVHWTLGGTDMVRFLGITSDKLNAWGERHP